MKNFVLLFAFVWPFKLLAQEPYAVLSDNNTVLTFYYDDQKDARNGMGVGPFTYNENDGSLDSGWFGQSESITSVVFDASFAGCKTITSTGGWFWTMENLSSIKGLEYLNTGNVTDMSCMFGRCMKLNSLDVTHFDTGKVTDMSYMFTDCWELTSLDVSSFDTGKVTDMSYMFADCLKLTSLDVTHFNTEKVMNMSGMFYGCRDLTSLDLSHFDTRNVTNMYAMFADCFGITSLDISSFDTERVTDMSYMFYELDLTSLDVTHFDTGNVTDMSGMFANCYKLTSLDLSHFDTRNVTVMAGMFGDCWELASLDVSSFDTGKVTDMSNMFFGCNKLTSLDLRHFDTRNVTVMAGMFASCYELTSLDVNSFDTGKVTDMSNMFEACHGLTSLDVSNFDTGNVTNMSMMFKNCSSLVTIYAGNNWSISRVEDGSLMFLDSNNVVGGAGTKYNGSHYDYTYAHIDGGTANPGYFTEKNIPATTETAAIPTFAVNNYMLTITTDTEEATIYYSVDGTEPTTESTIYTGPISLTQNCTVKAIAVKEGYRNSEVATFEFIEHKVWDFTKGLSEETITNLNADTENWGENGNDNGVVYNWKNLTKPSASEYLKANGITIKETEGLLFDIGNYSENSINLQTTTSGTNSRMRLTRSNTIISFPKLVNGQRIAVVGRSANGSATDRGIVPVQDYIHFVADESSPQTDGQCVFLGGSVENSEKIYTFVWEVETENNGPVDVSLQISPSGGIDFQKVIIGKVCSDPVYHSSGKYISITSLTKDAIFYYTLDGTDPTTESTLYTGPISLTQNCTVKAIAVKEGYLDSEVASFEFIEHKVWDFTKGLSEETIANLNADTKNWGNNGNDNVVTYNWTNLTKPSASEYLKANGITIKETEGLLFDIGNYSENSILLQTTTSGTNSRMRLTRSNTIISFPKLVNGQRIAVVGRSANGSATNRGIVPVQDYIHFVADESSPQTDGQCVFLGGSVENSEKIYTFVWEVETDENGPFDVSLKLTPSGGIDFQKVIIGKVCSDPVIHHDENSISITSLTKNATIYYTLDGSKPTIESSLYKKPISLRQDCTVKAIAIKDGYEASEISSYEFSFTKVLEIFEVETNATLTPGETIQPTASVKMTLGNDTEWRTDLPLDSWSSPLNFASQIYYGDNTNVKSHKFTGSFVGRNNPHDGDLVNSVSTGNSYNAQDKNLPQSGAYIIFEPLKNGSLIVPINVNVSKSLYVVDGFGNAITDFQFKTADGTTIAMLFDPLCSLSTEESTIGFISLNVNQGEKYYVFCNASKPRFGGYIFSENNVSIDPLTTAAVKDLLKVLPTCKIPIVSREGTTLVITTDINDASVYYTLDGTEPTKESSLYTEPIVITSNCTVKAIAVKEGYNNSEVATYEVDWFKVADVTFSVDGLQLTMATATEGATIRYTTDGTAPTAESGTVYTAPVELATLADGCTVQAIATKANFNPSEVATFEYHRTAYTTAVPAITFNAADSTVAMSCATEGAVIRYTLDGTDPTAASPAYTEKVKPERNCTVKAFATAEGLFSSAIAERAVNSFKVRPVTFSLSGLSLTLSTDTKGATIYYSTDGSEPQTAYTGVPITLGGAALTVRAYASRDGWTDSDITSYSYDPDKHTMEPPMFSRNGNELAVTAAVEGAIIYYTTDGSTPTEASDRYTAPITLTQNCTVRAFATAEGMLPSSVVSYDVTDFKVADVSFAVNDLQLSMATATEDAVIRYTTDGTPPTEDTGLAYGEPLPLASLTDGSTVYALATKENFNPSDVTWFVYHRSDYTVATPRFEESGNGLIISTPTEGASIYYTSDGTDPTTESTLYTSPISLNGNMTVKAIATAEGLFDSEIASHIVGGFQVDTPMMALDYATGRLTITCSTGGSTIYYKVGNGLTQDYSGPLTLTDNSSVRAWATAEGYNNSEVATLTPVPNGSMAAETFTINGEVTTQELLFVRNILGRGIEHLDMTGATLTDGRLDSEAFSGMSLLTARLPRTVGNMGERLFNGCRRLAAIVWNATTSIPTSAMAGIDNPNLLLYVSADGIGTNAGVRNLVVNGAAEEIVLSDVGAGGSPALPSDGNFFCPETFTARRAVYSHIYTQESGVGGTCKGWETLSLPFDVAAITHRVKGEVTPFGTQGLQIPENVPHFWLYTLGSSGFEASLRIEANHPYVISMPENPEFATRYCLGNDSIMFTATDVVFPVTAPQRATTGNKTLHAGFTAQDASDGIFAMNIGERYDDSHAEGSIFVPGRRAVRPFEAYATTTEAGVRYITLFGDEAQGIADLRIDDSRRDSKGVYDLGGRRISDSRHKRLAVSKGSTRIVIK